MILDTCFFIDDQRGRPETTAFLADHSSERLYVAVNSVGELACGFESTELPKLLHRLRHFQILVATAEAAVCYATGCRRLRDAGKMIGANDLWIAAIALTNHLPVATRNLEEFTRVPGLHVVGY